MPPPDELHQLSERDKSVIEAWIEQGAEYEPHWAYIVPERPALPEVSDPAWGSNPIDAFILAELDQEDINPSPTADRRTLIRRLTLDLLGLPPTPEQVRAFVGDERDGAYARLVDRLLASPHYGERMAVPQLDVVRYADTVGFHGDQRQNIFPYRDYVINAFNANKPYDEFVTEQIAGDLLPDPSEEQLVATGFNRLNMMTREGGAQPKEYLAKYNADRVRAVSTAFLGSTMACAECHDHKFDPFTTKDFYSMAAFFADVKQYGVYADYDYTPNPELKGWDNHHPFPPEIEVTSDYLVRRKNRLIDQLAEFLDEQAAGVKADPEQQEAMGRWEQLVEAFLARHPDGWVPMEPVKADSSRAEDRIEIKDGGLVSLSSKSSHGGPQARGTITITFKPTLGEIGTLKLAFVPDPNSDGKITRNSAGYFQAELKWFVKRPGRERPERIAMALGAASEKTRNFFNGYELPHLADRITSANALERTGFYMLFYPPRSIAVGPEDDLILQVRSRDVGSMRVAASPFGLVLPHESPADDLTESPAREYLRAGHFLSDALNDRRLQLQKEIVMCRGGRARTMVTQAVEPMEIRVLPRGNWQDDSGEVVLPETPAFLPKVGTSTEKRQTRLDLAEWLVHPDNPLTSRTFVNRLWKQFFGTGLSAVTDDLGSQGEWPSHPELLDWLAVEFVEGGWDVKAMVKLMVMSSTYRQSSKGRPELRELDPDNRLLARQNGRRLDAEFVRDNALALSGLLVTDIGGPSARPYQPPGYYEPLNFPPREYQPHTDERQYRRGLYMHWQRTFLHPMLANFDAPGREECTADRTQSNTPQQALTLLNDPTFVEAARVFAQGSLQQQPELDAAERVRALYFRTLGRTPTDKELDILTAFVEARADHYAEHPEAAEALTSVGLARRPETVEPAELAGWTALTRVLLNLNDTIMRY